MVDVRGLLRRKSGLFGVIFGVHLPSLSSSTIAFSPELEPPPRNDSLAKVLSRTESRLGDEEAGEAEKRDCFRPESA